MSDRWNQDSPGPFRRRVADPAAAEAAAQHRPSARRAAPDPEVYQAAEPEPEPDSEAALTVAGPAALSDGRKRPWIWRLFLAGLGLGFAALVAWLVDSAIASVGQRSLIGLMTAGSLGLLGLALAALVVGEVVSLARLRSRGQTRAMVEQAASSRDPVQAEAALSALIALHKTRPALAWALARYREEAADVPDAADKLVLYEQLVMGPLDEACAAEIRTIARRAAVLTAFAPNPILDALFVLWLNLSVVRRVARAQGLRPGVAASWALLRRTLLAMVAAGGMEALGDMAPAAVAGGVVRTVARRVGEGAVNGLLTIRIGVAALEACRPMPFTARERPSVTALARQVLGG
jgi:putative membrane protein